MDRLLYDLDTHEDASMINILLEALCLLISQISGMKKIMGISKKTPFVIFVVNKPERVFSIASKCDVGNWIFSKLGTF